jgi:hypothetical protein
VSVIALLSSCRRNQGKKGVCLDESIHPVVVTIVSNLIGGQPKREDMLSQPLLALKALIKIKVILAC